MDPLDYRITTNKQQTRELPTFGSEFRPMIVHSLFHCILTQLPWCQAKERDCMCSIKLTPILLSWLGQREFVNMLPLVCNDAVAILFMFDLSRKSTLNSIKEWYRQARGFNKVLYLTCRTRCCHHSHFCCLCLHSSYCFVVYHTYLLLSSLQWSVTMQAQGKKHHG
jgi:GTPase SAR1 family protein